MLMSWIVRRWEKGRTNLRERARGRWFLVARYDIPYEDD
jgi:hypothetical protein